MYINLSCVSIYVYFRKLGRSRKRRRKFTYIQVWRLTLFNSSRENENQRKSVTLGWASRISRKERKNLPSQRNFPLFSYSRSAASSIRRIYTRFLGFLSRERCQVQVAYRKFYWLSVRAHIYHLRTLHMSDITYTQRKSAVYVNFYPPLFPFFGPPSALVSEITPVKYKCRFFFRLVVCALFPLFMSLKYCGDGRCSVE